MSNLLSIPTPELYYLLAMWGLTLLGFGLYVMLMVWGIYSLMKQVFLQQRPKVENYHFDLGNQDDLAELQRLLDVGWTEMRSKACEFFDHDTPNR